MNQPQTIVEYNDPSDKIFIDPTKVVMIIKPSRLKGPEHMVAILLMGGAVLRLPIDEYEKYEFKGLLQIAGPPETV